MRMIERRQLNEKEKEHRERRLKSMHDCVTIEQFADNIFPSKHDEHFGSWAGKRKHLMKVIETYGVYRDEKLIIKLSEDIHKPEWDESDGLFQDLRENLVKWIKNYFERPIA
jgi:hypothetical protein